MKPLKLNDVVEFVEENIGSFHSNRLEKLKKLKLRKILRRKNPYLFKAKNLITAPDLIKSILDAHLSSQEETNFGEFLEKLAIFISEKVTEGRKSAAEGIDLEFELDGIIYLVAIKSGPNWGNSDQIKKMKTNFVQASRILRTNNPKANVRVINGCCYGKDKNPDKGEYLKLCGQRFWEFLSGNEKLYIDIIEPLGHRAKDRNDEFSKEYSKIINLFTKEFIDDYCVDGVIDWEKLVEFNSGKGQ